MKRVFAFSLATVAIAVAGCTSVRYPARNPGVDYEANVTIQPNIASDGPAGGQTFANFMSWV